MSVGKTVLWKRLSISSLLMLVVLLLVNGLCALLMAGGIIDHHMLTRGACVAWGMAATVAATFAVRAKDASTYEKWLTPLVAFVLVLSVSLVVGRGDYGGGLWWKCGVSAIVGVILSVLLVPKKRKKYAVGGGKRNKAKRR